MDEGLEIYKTINVFGKEIALARETDSSPDFQNDVVIPLPWAHELGKNIGITENFGITETIFNTWIIIGVVFIACLITRIKISKFKEIPTGFQNFIEGMVELVQNFVETTMGKYNAAFGPFYFGVFTFILLCNLAGLFCLRPPTGDFATTFALGLTSFFMIQGFAIANKGIGRYIKELFEPIPIFFPMNVISEIATPISLSFRLFGNILGGTIIMALYYSMPWLWAKLGIPAALHFYFDLFAGCLQAFIFTMLSMTFVANGTLSPEEKAEIKAKKLEKKNQKKNKTQKAVAEN